MSDRRRKGRNGKSSASSLPKEIEEQKRIHQWSLSKKRFQAVPCKAQRARDPLFYCILITHVGGVPVPDSLQDIDPHLSIRVSLFDLGSRQFFGNTWCSSPGELPGAKGRKGCRVSASGILDVPKFELPLYIYTYISDPNCAAVVEFVISEIDNATGMIVQSFGVGWTLVKCFGAGKSDLDGKKQIVSVYAGSPRSLLLLPTDVRRWEDVKDTLSPLMKATMSVQTLFFGSMETCEHLLPTDVLMSSDVRVPGIKSKHATLPTSPFLSERKRRRRGRKYRDDDDVRRSMQLQPIKLHRRSPLKLSGLKILMPFGFEERFEDDVTTIAELSVEKKERTNWEISDRWLDIGVHNTMRFVPFPNDEKGSKKKKRDTDDDVTIGRRPYFRVPLRHVGDSKDSSVDGFFLKQKTSDIIRLPQFVNHPSFAVVGILCYKARRFDSGKRRRRNRDTSAATKDDSPDTEEKSLSPLSEVTFQVATFTFLPVLGEGHIQVSGYFNFVPPSQSHAMRSGIADYDAKQGDTGRPLEIWMMPPSGTMNLSPRYRVYDGWVGNGRVIMAGISMKGKGHRLREIRSDSDRDSDADVSDFEFASSSSVSDDESISDKSFDGDADSLDGSGVPRWLFVGAKIEVRHRDGKAKKMRWVSATVEAVSAPDKDGVTSQVCADARLDRSKKVLTRVPLSRMRKRDGVPSVVSSVDTAYVRDMALRSKALAEGQELPPELAMAANALKLRLHGNSNGEKNGEIVAPSNVATEPARPIVRSSVGGSAIEPRVRPLTRATSTKLSQAGFRESRPSTSSVSVFANGQNRLRFNRRRWRSLQSPLASLPPAIKRSVLDGVRSPLQKHSITLTFAAWRAAKGHTDLPCAIFLRFGLFNSRPRQSPPLELVYARNRRYRRGNDAKRGSEDEDSSDEELSIVPRDAARRSHARKRGSEDHMWMLVPQDDDDEEVDEGRGSKTGREPRHRRRSSKSPRNACVMHFDVDAGLGGVSASRDFNTYLATKTMYVEVWDAESLLPIGCAAVPLRGLLRGAKDRTSTALEADVVASRTNVDGGGVGEGPLDVVQGMVVGDGCSNSCNVVGRLQILGTNVGGKSVAATDRAEWAAEGPRPKQPRAATATALLMDRPSQMRPWGRVADDADSDTFERTRASSRPGIRVRAKCLSSSVPQIQKSLHQRSSRKNVGEGDEEDDTSLDAATNVLTNGELAALVAGLGVFGSEIALRESWIHARPHVVRRDSFVRFVMGSGSEGLRAAMMWASRCASDLETALTSIDRDGSGVITREGFLYEAYKVGGIGSNSKEASEDVKAEEDASPEIARGSGVTKPTRQELAILASDFQRGGDIRYVDMLRVCGALPAAMLKLSKWFETEITDNHTKESRSSACEAIRRKLTRALSPDGSGLASASEVRKELSRSFGLTLRGPHWEAIVRLLRPPAKFRVDSRSVQFCGIVDLASGHASHTGRVRSKLRRALENYLTRRGDAFRDLFDHRGDAPSLFGLLSSLGVSILSGFGRNASENTLVGRQLSRLDRSTEFIDGIGRGDETGGASKSEKEEENADAASGDQLVDLETVRRWRSRRKRRVAEGLLRDALSWEHHVRAYFGRVCFFELPFVNPLDREERFRVTFEDAELRLITETEEWQAYRDAQLHSRVVDADVNRFAIQEKEERFRVEDNMFVSCSSGRDGRVYEFVLAAKERVMIPFVLCALSQDTALNPYSVEADQTMYRQTSVSFECTSTARTALVLDVVVHLSRPVVHRVIRLHVPENQFMCRSLRLKLPPSSGGLYVHCPDRDVAIETAPPETDVRSEIGINGSSQTVVLKYHCGAWPSTAQFFVALYADKYCAQLWEVWRVVVHSMRVVDARGTLGQDIGADLLIAPPNGARSRRRQIVRCYSSISSQIEFEPRGIFHMQPRSVTKAQLHFRPRCIGESTSLIHAVDVESRSVVGAWILRANATKPPVTKEFDVRLTLGEPSTKRIAYANQWDAPRVYLVSTNEPGYVKVKTPRLAMAARGRTYIRLLFPPREEITDMQVYVFVNRQDGQIEECLLFRLNWTA